jgi:hypothetical protein
MGDYPNCDFCGDKGSLQAVFNSTLTFCNREERVTCKDKYLSFVISNDLSYGIPFSMRKNISNTTIAFFCLYCGSRSNPIIHPRMPAFLQLGDNKTLGTFCKNGTCYSNCLAYMERLNGAPKTPWYFIRNIILNGVKNYEHYLPQEGEPGYQC